MRMFDKLGDMGRAVVMNCLERWCHICMEELRKSTEILNENTSILVNNGTRYILNTGEMCSCWAKLLGNKVWGVRICDMVRAFLRRKHPLILVSCCRLCWTTGSWGLFGSDRPGRAGSGKAHVTVWIWNQQCWIFYGKSGKGSLYPWWGLYILFYF